MEQFVDKGMCGYHSPWKREIHMHIFVLTTRPFKENGDWGNKEKGSS